MDTDELYILIGVDEVDRAQNGVIGRDESLDVLMAEMHIDLPEGVTENDLELLLDVERCEECQAWAGTYDITDGRCPDCEE